ncbi:MAG: tRNA epoxyqueuosine(34) reductase QueG [Planctomycetota bacterium]|nr:tRNA epoxyqueuosine(34) reductase QueG [Planctomycetota bacterium]MDP6941222.1 tRNA epoxyqueuosine(34) reductase QueG [Planctomycetota bacterium]
MDVPSPSSPGFPLPLVEECAAEVGLQVRGSVRVEKLSESVEKRLDQWLERGSAGEMGWLPRNRENLLNPQKWKPWVQGALLFALPYHRESGGFRNGGSVARYALGRDYHNLFGKKLERLGKRLREAGACKRFRAVTDAAPVLEREWAILNSSGFRGKSTMLLDPHEGPWLILGELLLDKEVPNWSPFSLLPNCGTCTACLDDCPTSAFQSPWDLDARKCISYLTIESRSPIPIEHRQKIGSWVFGCDVCLEVCPFGSKSPDYAKEWGTLDALEKLSLEDLLNIPEATFHKLFQGSPIRRATWEGLLRNACVVLGNLGRDSEALQNALGHPSPMVRGHSAWALGMVKNRPALDLARKNEREAWVLHEIESALETST